MTLYDWLMLTSIACLIVITFSGTFLLNRARKNIDQQTLEIKRSTEQLKAIPESVTWEMHSKLNEMKDRLILSWRIFMFVRRQRKKRKLKKRMMS